MLVVTLIVLALFAMWLQSKGELMQTLTTIQEAPSFAEYAMALVVFLIILSLIGEPYSTYLAGVTIMGLIYLDFEKNGTNNIWSIFKTS